MPCSFPIASAEPSCGRASECTMKEAEFRQDLRAELVRRLLQPGAWVLILASNVNEPTLHGALPRVLEEESRSGFSRWSDVV